MPFGVSLCLSEGGAWSEEVRASVRCEDKRRMGREATVVTVGESESERVSVSVKRRGEAGKGESAHGMR